MKNTVILLLITFSLVISLTSCGKSSGEIIPIASTQKTIVNTNMYFKGDVGVNLA